MKSQPCKCPRGTNQRLLKGSCQDQKTPDSLPFLWGRWLLSGLAVVPNLGIHNRTKVFRGHAWHPVPTDAKGSEASVAWSSGKFSAEQWLLPVVRILALAWPLYCSELPSFHHNRPYSSKTQVPPSESLHLILCLLPSTCTGPRWRCWFPHLLDHQEKKSKEQPGS